MNPFLASISAAAAVALCALPGFAYSQAQRQDTSVVRQSVEQFLRVQTAGLPGEVNISVGNVDARTNLPECAAPQAFMPNGSRIWGKTTVGVRCTTPSPWTIYVAATVQVIGEYVMTAAPLAQGHMVGSTDIVKIRGDLTTLPIGIITDANQAIGRTVSISLPSGAPLRSDSLRTLPAVQQGQSVRVISAGPGFRVSAEARALNNASEGQIAQARTASGQVVSGIAKAGGVVEVNY